MPYIATPKVINMEGGYMATKVWELMWHFMKKK